MDRNNLSEADLLSIVSLKYARNEVLEPPWYGFYGIILREHMSRVEDNIATLFIPQLPITVEVNEVDIDSDDDDASNARDDEDHDTDSDGGYESPTPARATSTDVESFHLPTKISRPEPSSRPTIEKKSTVPELSKSARHSSEMSVAEYQRFLSTRIPDFVRRRFYLDENLNIKASRIDLVVELKKSFSTPSKTRRSLVEAELQTREQAAHALAEDEHLKVVGYIAAVGNVWRYGEVDRSKTSGGIYHANRDSTYTPGSSFGTPSTEASPSNLRTPPATRNQGFQRSPAPSPDSPEVLNSTPKVFTDPTSPAQKAWLTAIHERLNFLDMEMAALYT